MADLKMPQTNILILSGRLLRDPELKHISSGTATVKTGLAVDSGFGDKKTTIFVDLQLWGKYAETMHPHLYKGAPVLAEGRLDVYEWETKEGEKRKSVVLVANRIQVLAWGNDGGQADVKPHDRSRDREPEPDDDLPF